MVEMSDRWRESSPSGVQSLLPKTKGSKQANAGTAVWEQDVPPVPSWPGEARPLHHQGWSSYFETVVDVLLVLCPFYFLLIGVAALVLHKKPVQGYTLGMNVEAAIKLGPTIFPIMFAAICGRSLKMIGIYMAEKGAKLGTLELLMSSDSVWSTIETQFLMRRLTLVGGHLLLLWALSPLGGQASLRLMSRGESLTPTTEKWRYMSTGPLATQVGRDNGADDNFIQANALYGAAILAPIKMKTEPVDTWGHVKIPYLGKNISKEWTAVKLNNKPEDYVSLVGIPVARPQSSYPNADIEFPLEATYLNLQCGYFKEVGPLKALYTKENPTHYNFSLIESLIPGQIWRNMSGQTNKNPFDEVANDYTFFFQTDLPLYPYEKDSDLNFPGSRFDASFGFQNTSALDKLNASFSGPRTITLASRFGPPESRGLSADVEVIAAALRGYEGPEQILALGHSQPLNILSLGEICSEHCHRPSPKSTERPRRRNSSSTIQRSYLWIEWSLEHVQLKEVNLSRVPSDVFSRRLSTVLNTYFQLAMAPVAYTATLSQNMSAYGPDTLPFSDVDKYLPGNLSAANTTYADWGTIATRQYNNQSGNNLFVGATTNATITRVKEIYTCNFAWLAALWVVSSVVLLIGVCSLVLKRMTLAPDMFGYVSSMTYENPYMRLPRGGGALDAMERTRALRDVQVRVGDVRGHEEVGHVAFAAGVPTRRLERDRLYM